MCLDALDSLLLFVIALERKLGRKGKSKAKQNRKQTQAKNQKPPWGRSWGNTGHSTKAFSHAGEPLTLHVLYSLSQPSDWIFLPSEGLDHISLTGKWHQVELYLIAKD